MALYFFLRWLGVLILGLLVYGQTFRYDFVFDDHIFIVNNALIKNLSNIHLIWHSFPITRMVGIYSFALNYHFNRLDPLGYHIFNFAVHLICTGLVWGLAGLLFKTTRVLPSKDPLVKELPFMMALLFLVHPGQTQAVTYITQRFESMAAMFYLAAVYFYLWARWSTVKAVKSIFFVLAFMSLGFGVLTKEVIMTVPLMIMACEWIVFPKKLGMRFYIICAFSAVLLVLLFARILHIGLKDFAQAFPSASHDGDMLTPGRYFLTEFRVFLTFMRLLILPVHQNLDYDYPASTGLLHPPLTLLGLGVMAAFVFSIIRLRQNHPLIAFGLAWMLITFSINFAPRTDVIFEHKLYLISFGFFLSLTAGLYAWLKNAKILIKILCCIMAVWAVMAWQRNKVWSNELKLWQNAVQESPHKARVNASLGRMYATSRQYDMAIAYLTRAIAIKPDNISYENRGVVYGLQGQYGKALEDLNTSIAMEPTYFPTYVKRSWVYQNQHNFPAALADLQQAIALDPYFTDAYIERGLLWTQMGHWDNALQDFDQVLKIDPLNQPAAEYRQQCLMHVGRT